MGILQIFFVLLWSELRFNADVSAKQYEFKKKNLYFYIFINIKFSEYDLFKRSRQHVRLRVLTTDQLQFLKRENGFRQKRSRISLVILTVWVGVLLSRVLVSSL